MKNTIHFLALFFSCLISFQAFGQVPEPMKNITTPNVASLGTYGDTPVNTYTGQPNVSITLYDVVEDNLKIPLLLSYDLSSVKPNKHASWVGLGWNLSCGGQITRSVRGIMDEKQVENGYASGYYAHCGKMKGITNVGTLASHQNNFMNDVSIDGYELTADEFMFNFCGYSGKFYLNENKEWTVISDDDIKMEFNETDGFISARQLRGEIMTSQWSQKAYCNRFFNQFVLVAPNGVRYTFGGRYATEYSISYYSQNSSDLIPTTWYLSKVENTEGKYITFEYEAGSPVCELKYSPWEIYRENIHCAARDNIGMGRNALSGYLLFPVYMKKINTTFATVKFYAVPENRDYKQNPVFMTSTDQTSPVSPHTGYGGKGTRFDIFFNVSAPNIKVLRDKIVDAMNWKRLHAIEVQHNRTDTLGNKTMYFNYQNPGYYKQLTKVSERRGNYKKRTIYKLVGENTYAIVYVPPLYPTDYIPKEYGFGYDANKKLPVPVYGSEDHWGYWNGYDFSFTETAAEAITKKGSMGVFAKAETLKYISYPTGGKSEFEYEENTYSKVVAPTFTSVDDKNAWGIGGGLRVSQIKVYNGLGVLDRIKNYYYTSDFANIHSDLPKYSSGILKNKPIYESFFTTDGQLRLWKLWGGKNSANDSTACLGLRQAGGFMAQATNNDTPPVGYSSVFEETQDADGRCQGYTRYRYTNYDTDIWGGNHLDEQFLFATADGESYANQFSSKSQERGKPMAQEFYDANGKELKSVRYKYQKVYGNANEYLTTVHQQTIFLCSSDPYAVSYGTFSSAFKTFTYSYLPSECIETTYGLAGGEVVGKTVFSYNRNKLLAEKKIYGSNGDEYKEKFVYSSDLAGKGIKVYSDMKAKHILNAAVESTQIKDGYVTASNYIKYGEQENSVYKPITLYKLAVDPKIPENAIENGTDNQGNPSHAAYKVKKEISYNYYNGNVSCIKDETGMYTSYLWGYEDRYPVAEFKNATIDEMEQALSETAFLIFEPHLPEEIIENLPELKTHLPKAHISVYAYIPLIGIERFCDSRGYVEYYEYDELGQLLRVKDVNGKVIKEHKYSYRDPY